MQDMAFYNTHIPSITKKEACETEVKKNVPTTRRKSIALGLLGLLLCLPVVDSRPSQRRQGRAMEAVGEFLYRERIEQPCRIMTPPRSVGRSEVAGAVERATAALARATDTLGEQDCRDLHLTSILGSSTNFTGMSRSEQAASLHLSTTSLQAHLLFLRLDWATSPGLPCGGSQHTKHVTRDYTELAQHWEGLSCLLSLHLEPLLEEGVKERNIEEVLEEGVHRRRECAVRRTRDCIVLKSATTLLNRLLLNLAMEA